MAVSRAKLLREINPSILVFSRLLLFIKVANNIIEEWHRTHFLLERNDGCWPWWRRLPLSSTIRRNIFLSCLCLVLCAVCRLSSPLEWVLAIFCEKISWKKFQEKWSHLGWLLEPRGIARFCALNDSWTPNKEAEILDSLSRRVYKKPKPRRSPVKLDKHGVLSPCRSPLERVRDLRRRC